MNGIELAFDICGHVVTGCCLVLYFFYKVQECEELMSKGITGTGEGFDLSGKRLGGSTRQPPLCSLRKTALTAAENRKKLNSLLPSGPLRLGGDKNIMSALSPVQAAAMAAERRLQDEIWCASASGGLNPAEEGDCDLLETVVRSDNVASSSSNASSGNDGDAKSRKRSQRVDTINVIDLSHDVDTTSLDVRGAESSKKSNGSSRTSSSALSITGASTSNHATESTYVESVMWTCEACTLLNPVSN